MTRLRHACHVLGDLTALAGFAALYAGATPEVTAERCAWLLAHLLALLVGVVAGAP